MTKGRGPSLAKRTSSEAPPWLLLKANALRLPLRSSSVAFAIATPPHFGVKNLGRDGFCTGDKREFRALVSGVERECLRVLKPGGYAAFNTRQGRTRLSKPFQIFQKRRSGRGWQLHLVRAHNFRVHYVDVDGFWWWALPLSVYTRLLERYSQPGEVVAHIFCGSGNGGMAIVRAHRKAVLVDLHYHTLSQRRLRRQWRALGGLQP